MNQLDTEQKSTTKAVDANGANTRLTGPWLIIARVLWLALVIPSLGLFVAGLPVSYQLMQRACADPVTCNLSGILTAKELQALLSSGISVSVYAALVTMFVVIITAFWCGVGFLLFWRRSDDWLALLAAFFLVMFGITSTGNSTYALALASPVLALPIYFVFFLAYIFLFLFFLLFPSGRFVPRWMGLMLLLIIILGFFNYFPSPTSPFNEHWPVWLNLLITLASLGAIIFSQIYRYRRVSTAVQHQQTKWIVLGATVALGVAIVFFALTLPFSSNVNSNYLGALLLVTTIIPVALLLIPLSIGFSILRYRLYDIDILINRTLVYGTLTVLLSLVYFGLIFVLQSLLPGINSPNNDVAIVVSTLAIAALFQPLRHRIQRVIDRRFYRRKYDAAKIVEAFSATLRNEVDLNQLREQLLTIVQETMQPAHVSLWLRSHEHEEKHQAPWRANPPVSSDRT